MKKILVVMGGGRPKGNTARLVDSFVKGAEEDADPTYGRYERYPVKVHAALDGEPYDGSIVNMGVQDADGNICYVIGVRKDIRSRIGKQPGDRVLVTVRERE